MAPSPDRIWNLAVAVKAAVIDGFADAGVTLPDRQFITYGQLPAHDCAELVVAVESTFGYEGAVQQEVIEPALARAGHTMRGARVAIHLLRCVPVVGDDGEIPSEADEEEAAEEVLTDAQVVLTAVVAAQRAGDLPRCGGVAFEQWTAVSPAGGIGGGILRVRLTLE